MMWHIKEVNSKEKKWQRKTKSKSTRRRTWRKDYTLDSVCPLCVVCALECVHVCVYVVKHFCVSWIFSILKQPRRQAVLQCIMPNQIQLIASYSSNILSVHDVVLIQFNWYFSLFSLVAFPLCHHHHRHRCCRQKKPHWLPALCSSIENFYFVSALTLFFVYPLFVCWLVGWLKFFVCHFCLYCSHVHKFMLLCSYVTTFTKELCTQFQNKPNSSTTSCPMFMHS